MGRWRTQMDADGRRWGDRLELAASFTLFPLPFNPYPLPFLEKCQLY